VLTSHVPLCCRCALCRAGGLTIFLVNLYILQSQGFYQSGLFLNDPTAAAVVGLSDSAHLRAIQTSTALITGLSTITLGVVCNTPLLISTGMCVRSARILC
jgi:xanthine/uracil/vitamin C permease (AzgA family)